MYYIYTFYTYIFQTDKILTSVLALQYRKCNAIVTFQTLPKTQNHPQRDSPSPGHQRPSSRAEVLPWFTPRPAAGFVGSFL